jgi:hypothetical protein
MYDKTFKYGVTGRIGNKLIVKLRIMDEDWSKVRELLLKELVDYTMLYRNKKFLKHGIGESTYVHFQALCTAKQFNTIRGIIKMRKSELLKQEALVLFKLE